MMCALSCRSLSSSISAISLVTASSSCSSPSHLTCLSARILRLGASTLKTCDVPPRPIGSSFEYGTPLMRNTSAPATAPGVSAAEGGALRQAGVCGAGVSGPTACGFGVAAAVRGRILTMELDEGAPARGRGRDPSAGRRG